MALHDAVVQAEVVTSLGVVLSHNKLTYTCSEGPFASADPQAITDALQAKILNSWRACLSENARIVAITTRLDQKPPYSNFPPATNVLSNDGTVASEMMPPFVTGVITKVPDNENKLPIDAPDFKGGRLEIGGMPESMQANGILTSGGVIALQNLADDLFTFEVTIAGVPATWELMMYRLLSNPIRSENVMVQSVFAQQRMGSRVSRKFRPSVWL